MKMFKNIVLLLFCSVFFIGCKDIDTVEKNISIKRVIYQTDACGINKLIFFYSKDNESILYGWRGVDFSDIVIYLENSPAHMKIIPKTTTKPREIILYIPDVKFIENTTVSSCK